MVDAAVGAAHGNGQFPNNRFSPTLFSQLFIYFNRIASVCDEITNTEYEGEISNYGDSIEMMKEPEISVTPYTRGQKTPIQPMNDGTLQLKIDQAQQFTFAVDDIEKRLSHLDWLETGKSSGMYGLMNSKDADILQYMHDNATDVASGDLGTAGSPVTVGFGGSDTSPLEVINILATELDKNDVPREGRWFVASPDFYRRLNSEDSSLAGADFTGDDISVIRDGKYGTASSKRVYGFRCYVSNNNPTSSSSDETVMAGHVNSTTTASAIVKTEVFRHPEFFGDACRGLLVYGRKVVKPENLLTGYITF